MDADGADATRRRVQFPKHPGVMNVFGNCAGHYGAFAVIRGIRMIRVIVVQALMPAPRRHSGPSLEPDEQRSLPLPVPSPASFLGGKCRCRVVQVQFQLRQKVPSCAPIRDRLLLS